MQLVLNNNSVTNPLSIDLSTMLDVQRDEGMDPYDPNFSERLFSHSLLKEGGTLALESRKLKELLFPLKLKSTSSSGIALLVQQINQILETGAGAIASWQDDGLSQPTIFDLASGQLDIEYDFRMAQQHWLKAKLRLFAQPLGRVAGPRVFARASGVGPLLIVTPYGSTGQNILGASAGGFGGVAQASGGVFYPGSPSLAGDASALLQVSYVGPLPSGATALGIVPYVAMSLLPDQYYQPLIDNAHMNGAGGFTVFQAGAVASQYTRAPSSGVTFQFLPPGASFTQEPTISYAGNHRLFAIARASQATGVLSTVPGPLIPFRSVASVTLGDWALYDLGVITIRASEPSIPNLFTNPISNVSVVASGAPIDLTAFVVLPDATTWFLSPTGMASTLGDNTVPPFNQSPYTNTFLLDDTLGDQFCFYGQSQTFAPSPTGMVASSTRITQLSRGLVPRPDPRNGLPIIAFLGVGQAAVPSLGTFRVGASWTNQQTLRTMAQINVLERTRYVFS